MTLSQSPVCSLVGGMIVAHSLSQDPLFIPINSLDASCYFISRFGHIITRGGDGTAKGRRPARETRQKVPLPWLKRDFRFSEPTRPSQQLLFSRLPDPQWKSHGTLLEKSHQHSTAHGFAWRFGVIVEASNLGSCVRRGKQTRKVWLHLTNY